MAETLTFENTQETTTVDNLTPDEQDSLQVGEAMQEAQDDLLAGKYKNAQELEKAYVELSKKLGEKNTEDSEPAGESTDTTEGEKETEEKEEAKEDTEGNILDILWEQTLDNQNYKDETIAELEKLSSTDIAKLHMEYRSKNAPQQINEEDVKTLKNIAGGDKEYDDMLRWATSNLNKQEVDMFDAVMEKGDPLAAFFAVRSLAYRYEDSKGVDGRMLTGTAPKETGTVFRSQAEVVKAMSDPRYERDPAYRQDIMKKLERSDVNF